MSSRTLPPSTDAGTREKSARVPATARAALALLQRLRAGTLTVHTPDGATHQATGATCPELQATICVHDWSVFTATMRTGDIGFAEGFMAGEWTTPHLPDLLRLLLANRDVMTKAI